MNTETILLHGSDDEVEALLQGNLAFAVDHRSEEDLVLKDLIRLIPGFSSSHQIHHDATVQITARFLDRSFTRTYADTPYNAFRVLLDCQKILGPNYEIRVFAHTMDSDTHVFLVRSGVFWKTFDTQASDNRRQLFNPISFLDVAWGLSEQPTGRSVFWTWATPLLGFVGGTLAYTFAGYLSGRGLNWTTGAVLGTMFGIPLAYILRYNLK